MTDLAETAAPTRHDLAAVEAVADNFVDLMRSFVRARNAMMQAAQHDVEWSARVVLRCLGTHGSMRAGALAEALGADPSTISRQVAAVVKDGLVERQADPEDGRASILVLTAKGRDVMADHDRIRLEYFAEMLTDWTENDLNNFSELLARFSRAYNDMNHDWMNQRVGTAGRSRGTN